MKEETLLHPGKPPYPGRFTHRRAWEENTGLEDGRQHRRPVGLGRRSSAGRWHLGFGDQNQRAAGDGHTGTDGEGLESSATGWLECASGNLGHPRDQRP